MYICMYICARLPATSFFILGFSAAVVKVYCIGDNWIAGTNLRESNFQYTFRRTKVKGNWQGQNL